MLAKLLEKAKGLVGIQPVDGELLDSYEEVKALPESRDRLKVGNDCNEMVRPDMTPEEQMRDKLWQMIDSDTCPFCHCGEHVDRHPTKFLTFYRIARGGGALNIGCRHCQARFWFSGLRAFGAEFQGYDTTDKEPAANEFSVKDWKEGTLQWHYVSPNSGWDTSDLKLQ